MPIDKAVETKPLSSCAWTLFNNLVFIIIIIIIIINVIE